MFAPGEIVYFTPFYFQDGQSAPKEKYFIVLGNHNNETIIASLPTRSNKAPFIIGDTTHGCLNDNERQFSCYLFEQNKRICDNGFCFPLQTFIYGDAVQLYDVNRLKTVSPVHNKDYRIEGKLNDDEFSKILECLENSNAVKRKVLKKLFG